MNLPDRIKSIRQGLKQDEFAIKLGVNKNTVGRWERAEQVPNVEDLTLILKVYPDINPAWLLTGEGEMKREYVEITKEDPKGFGRAKELTYRVYPGFGSRLTQRLGGTTIEGLAEASKLPLDTVNGLLVDKIPTVDELLAVTEALNIPIRWLSEGEKAGAKTVINYQQNTNVFDKTKDTFIDRLNKMEVQATDKLSEDSGIAIDRINELLSGASTPTDEEIQQLGKGLAVNPKWLSIGEDAFVLDKAGLDEDLLKNILGAIEIVADDFSRDEKILSVSDRIMITIKLYNTFFDRSIRHCVTLDNMIGSVMDTYFLRMSFDKIANLKNKLQQEPPNEVVDIINTIDNFVTIRKDIEEFERIEGEKSQTEKVEKRSEGEDNEV